MSYFTYLVECRDKSYYCGYTNDLKKRIETHNSGTGGKYTKRRLPVKLIYFEEFETRSEAMKRECEIKKFSRVKKEELVKKIK
jgi:putative endonuclease